MREFFFFFAQMHLLFLRGAQDCMCTLLCRGAFLCGKTFAACAGGMPAIDQCVGFVCVCVGKGFPGEAEHWC